VLDMLDSIEEAIATDSWSEPPPALEETRVVAQDAISSSGVFVSKSAEPVRTTKAIGDMPTVPLRTYPDLRPAFVGVRAKFGTTAAVLATFKWSADA
jgi:hypothetical protein